MKQVGSLVGTQETISVGRDATVVEAARRMAEHNIGAVPVVDADRVVGIFTERDVMTRVVAERRDPARTLVGDVMSTSLVTAQPTDSYEECLRLMQRASIRHLLVLSEGRLAGVVSLRDLLRVDVDEKEEAISLLSAYVHDIPVVWAKR